MRISILTLFPEMFTGPFDFSIIKIAIDKKLVEIEYINIRDFGIGKHRIVDDTPYGGGIGMVMRADVIARAIEFAKKTYPKTPLTKKEPKRLVVLLDAGGKKFDQPITKSLSELDHLILICGHYEGIDERINKYIDEKISIGDFIVTGGEIPAMLITDSIIRLLPGVLKSGASENESFSLRSDRGDIYLEYPHYTKPREFENIPVPQVLLSGDHKKISEWRNNQAIIKTAKERPELLKKSVRKK